MVDPTSKPRRRNGRGRAGRIAAQQGHDLEMKRCAAGLAVVATVLFQSLIWKI
jgi:hypothetical protein